MLRLWRKLRWILDSPGDMSRGAQKRQSYVETALSLLGVSLPSFPSFKERSEWWASSVQKLSLSLVELELLLFCLD